MSNTDCPKGACHSSGSTDEDFLDNTKPNLLSLSLSTSSSNYTAVSVVSDESKYEEGTNISGNALSETLEKREDLQHVMPNNIASFPLVSEISCPDVRFSVPDKVRNCPLRLVDSDFPDNPYMAKDSCGNKTDKVLSTSILHTDFTADFNLCNEDCLCNKSLLRAASQPQLHCIENLKNNELKRSLSSLSFKKRNKMYDHIESKVKHYIEHLKRTRINSNCEGKKKKKESNEIKKSGNEQLEENGTLLKLQEEIEKLKNDILERDSLLHEVQVNHHLLLLQYGEAKNHLDQLRFTSGRQQIEMKSVQTECNLLLDGNMLDYSSETLNSCGDLKKIFPFATKQLEDDYSHATKIQKVMELTQKIPIHVQNTRGSSSEVSPKINYTSMCSASEPKDFYLSSLRQLPVPSCYGSLGSSGSVSQQPQDVYYEEKDSYLKKTQFLNALVEDKICFDKPVECNKSQFLINHCKYESLKYNIGNEGQTKTSSLPENEFYFLPIDRCDCWTPQNILEHNSLEQDSTEASNIFLKPGLKSNFIVPPLNLEGSKGSVSSFPQKTILSVEKSQYTDISESQREFDLSCQKNEYFQSSFINSARARDKDILYPDTPTSYRSIQITQKVGGKTLNISHLPMSFECSCSQVEESSLRRHQKCHGINIEKHTSEVRCCHQESIAPRINQTSKTCSCENQVLRCNGCTGRFSATFQNPEIPPDLKKILNNMSACAEELKRKSEIIQCFLTSLVNALD